MMQTTGSGLGYDLTAHARIARCRAATGCFLCQRKMNSILVIVADVLIHEAFQMPFIQNDHVV
jgi:hypothetical protein